MRDKTFDTRGPGFIRVVSALFPETRADEMAVLDAGTEALARYVAFVHELTVREALELIEIWVLPAFAEAVETARAA